MTTRTGSAKRAAHSTGAADSGLPGRRDRCISGDEAIVPVASLPRHAPLSGPCPPLGPVARGGWAAGRTNKGRTPCISPVPHDPSREWESCCRNGPCPPLGPVARGSWAAGRTNKGRAPCISPVPLVYPPRMRHRSLRRATLLCRSGPCPRKRGFRSIRFHGTHRFRGHGPLLHDRPDPHGPLVVNESTPSTTAASAAAFARSPRVIVTPSVGLPTLPTTS